MTKNEFALAVRIAASSDLSPDTVEKAIRHYQTTGKHSRGEVSDAIGLAAMLQDTAQAGATKEGGTVQNAPFVGPLVPETVITTDLLVDQIRPEVEKLRKQLFGSTAPPFPDYSDAIDWIDGEKQSIRDELEAEETQRVSGIKDEIHTLMQEMARLRDRSLTFILQAPYLSYASAEDDSTLRTPLPWDSPLYALRALVVETSQLTGFTEASLVAYVLSGEQPVVPRIAMSNEVLVAPVRLRKLTVTIQAREPCREDFLTAYALYKKERGKTRARRMDGTDLAIFKLVREHGGSPQKDPGEFWDTLSNELERREAIKLKPISVRRRFERFPQQYRDAM